MMKDLMLARVQRRYRLYRTPQFTTYALENHEDEGGNMMTNMSVGLESEAARLELQSTPI